MASSPHHANFFEEGQHLSHSYGLISSLKISRITNSVVATASDSPKLGAGMQPKQLGSSSNEIRSGVLLYSYGEALPDSRSSAALASL